ncbi:hydroxymethylglutaryl-CoA synthase [Ligilactobacillus sp. WILCCON 0076]|uniref:Hydroxymethylglutaryl-CoA synthase n=1 Tax=Ligilactobacillus ubinensis TaxID=2876789 RepID=A0A9X2JKV7_9LACO|nr:hydroxymethylglutaryl-CoA synthase [Ligilactobacillus ubinensis]MCP0886438.1 hydroxymethylglutaryl-CoA synthase [Ligilactobacillus ubinensis]
MKIGIDKIGFFTSNLYVDMAKLAVARNVDPNKYLIGIGQTKMAVIPPTQDVVTLAANAANRILTVADKEQIDMVLLATESGIDNSKSAAAYVANLLGLNEKIRVVELKQACYGATAALQLARTYIAVHPTSKILVIGADIARYGLNTPGEPTQGGGAVAMLVTKDPAILAIEDESSYLTRDIMDFWRPLGHYEALVDGKYSSDVYLDFFNTVFTDYKSKTGLKTVDFSSLLFHLPYTKLGLKALRLAVSDLDKRIITKLNEEFENSRIYSKKVGNLYTGSLYLSLLSVLENSQDLLPGQRLGLFSYGSGAEGEFYSGILQSKFKQQLIGHKELLKNRKEVTVAEYEKIYKATVTSQTNIQLDYQNDPATFIFSGIDNNKRQYLHR